MCSVEFAAGRRLLRAHAPGDNLGLEVILPANGAAGQPPQYGDLPDVREGIGYRPLEELFRGGLQGRIRSEVVVEQTQCGKEPRRIIGPRAGCRVLPLLLAARL